MNLPSRFPYPLATFTAPGRTESTKRSESDRYTKILYSRTKEMDREVVDRVGQVAERRGVSRAQVAFAWILAEPGCTAKVVAATKPHHLCDASADLSPQLMP